MLLDIAFGLFVGKLFGYIYFGVIFALLPDVDVLLPKSFKNTTLFSHRGITHTPIFYLIIATMMCLLSIDKNIILIFLICTFFHLIHDLMVIGRGVMIFWPLSNNRLKIFPNDNVTGYFGKLYVWWNEEKTPMYTELSYVPNNEKKILGLPQTFENENWFRDWYLRPNLFLFTETGLAILFFILYLYD